MSSLAPDELRRSAATNISRWAAIWPNRSGSVGLDYAHALVLPLLSSFKNPRAAAAAILTLGD